MRGNFDGAGKSIDLDADRPGLESVEAFAVAAGADDPQHVVEFDVVDADWAESRNPETATRKAFAEVAYSAWLDGSDSPLFGSLTGMDFFARSKDLIAIAIAVVAVILSLITVLVQRRQQRQHAFQQIHDVLMTPEHQRGRWLMWDIAEAGSLPDQGSPDYYLINRTLGMLDLLAFYARRGVVPRRWVLERWHHPLQQMAAAVTVLVEERIAVAGWRPWPHLNWLILEATSYRSSEGCCLPAPLTPRQSGAPTEPSS